VAALVTSQPIYKPESGHRKSLSSKSVHDPKGSIEWLLNALLYHFSFAPLLFSTAALSTTNSHH